MLDTAVALPIRGFTDGGCTSVCPAHLPHPHRQDSTASSAAAAFLGGKCVPSVFDGAPQLKLLILLQSCFEDCPVIGQIENRREVRLQDRKSIYVHTVHRVREYIQRATITSYNRCSSSLSPAGFPPNDRMVHADGSSCSYYGPIHLRSACVSGSEVCCSSPA